MHLCKYSNYINEDINVSLDIKISIYFIYCIQGFETNLESHSISTFAKPIQETVKKLKRDLFNKI